MSSINYSTYNPPLTYSDMETLEKKYQEPISTNSLLDTYFDDKTGSANTVNEMDNFAQSYIQGYATGKADEQQKTYSKELNELNEEYTNIMSAKYKLNNLKSMNLKNILQNMYITLLNISQDILLGNFNSIPTFFMIFFKGHRMLYLGIFIIIVSIFLALLNLFGR